MIILDEYLPESEHFSSVIETIRKELSGILNELEESWQRKEPMFVFANEDRMTLIFLLLELIISPKQSISIKVIEHKQRRWIGVENHRIIPTLV